MSFKNRTRNKSEHAERDPFKRTIGERARDTAVTVAENAGLIAVAGLAALSFVRLSAEILDEVGAQHGGESLGAEVVDWGQGDYNKFRAAAHMYTGDEHGYGSQELLNDLALADLVITAVALKAKE